jgi:hypothetical protein
VKLNRSPLYYFANISGRAGRITPRPMQSWLRCQIVRLGDYARAPACRSLLLLRETMVAGSRRLARSDRLPTLDEPKAPFAIIADGRSIGRINRVPQRLLNPTASALPPDHGCASPAVSGPVSARFSTDDRSTPSAEQLRRSLTTWDAWTDATGSRHRPGVRAFLPERPAGCACRG